MQILCLDESGTHGESRRVIVAGLAVPESQVRSLAAALDEVQADCFPGYDGTFELHASELAAFHNKNVHPAIRSLPNHELIAVITKATEAITGFQVSLFAAVIDKAHEPDRPYATGFEQVVSRFDQMLARVRHRESESGIVIIAESRHRSLVEADARRIWSEGHAWGQLRNMAMFPLFAWARDSRLLQCADFISNAVFRRYEYGDSRLFDVLARHFDAEDERLHGLVHLTPDRSCMCLACFNRRTYRQSRYVAEEPMEYGSDAQEGQL